MAHGVPPWQSSESGLIIIVFLLAGGGLGRGSLVPASETLDFPVPPGPPLREFDQFIVRFHRDLIRIDRSARIAIERFALVSRGG
jgi:hypothetical protein